MQFPVLLYLDGHSSHLTIPLAQFCLEKKIELIVLYPHSTHILQPLDTSFFHPFKEVWKRIVPVWKIENDKTRVTRADFASVLKLAIDSFIGAEKAIINGFKGTGLLPFNPDAPNFNVLKKRKKSKSKESHQPETSGTSGTSEMSTINLIQQEHDVIEKNISPDLLQEFLRSEAGSWTGELKNTGLFEFWRKLKNKKSGILITN